MSNSKCKVSSLYNEIKATQVACLLIQLNGGEMDYAKCIKLLYGIEREALSRWTRPVLYDRLCSMPYGQVVSQTLDRANYRTHKPQSFWSKHLNTDETNHIIRVVKKCGIEQLSRAEIELIKEIYQANKLKSAAQLFDEHHNPALFPEYKDPDGSSIETDHLFLLTLLGKTKEEIAEFEADMNELENLQALTR